METYNIKTKTDGRCRVYPDNPNGPAPSVTSITQILFKGGLLQWAADCAVKFIGTNILAKEESGFNELLEEARFAYKNISEEAAGTGTDIHALCQLYLEGKHHDLEVSLLNADEVSTGLVKAFGEWCEKNKIKPVFIEQVLHARQYSGRCDLIAYRTDPKTGIKKLGLYDLKTGKGSYYPEWGLQLAAYEAAYNDWAVTQPEGSHPWPIEEVGIIKLNKETLKANFSEDTRGPNYTKHMRRLYNAFDSLVEFYWLYNDIETQLKEISDGFSGLDTPAGCNDATGGV